jgi:DNA-binding transcriptional ArsR family regulator
VAAAAAGPPPDGDLLKALRAVADGTRLRALELLAERPRPTQELAPLIGITEPGLSKHLRQLREAGIVAARREGPYVIYSLVPERLAALGRDLAALARRAHSGSGD